MKTKFLRRGSVATLGLASVLVIGLVVAVILVGRTSIFQNQAASSQATVSMVSDRSNLSDDEQASVAIFVDPKGKEMVFVNLTVRFDPNVVSFEGFSDLSSQLQLVSANQSNLASGDQTVQVIAIVPKPNNPISTPVQFGKIKFSVSTNAVGVTTSNLNLTPSSEIVALPSQDLTISDSPISLKVNARTKIMQDLGLKITGKNETGSNQQLNFSWNPVANQELLKYRIIITDSSGTRVNTDQGGVPKTETNFSPSGVLPSGNYTVTLSAILPNKVFQQVKSFQIEQNNEISQ